MKVYCLVFNGIYPPLILATQIESSISRNGRQPRGREKKKKELPPNLRLSARLNSQARTWGRERDGGDKGTSRIDIEVKDESFAARKLYLVFELLVFCLLFLIFRFI